MDDVLIFLDDALPHMQGLKDIIDVFNHTTHMIINNNKKSSIIIWHVLEDENILLNISFQLK